MTQDIELTLVQFLYDDLGLTGREETPFELMKQEVERVGRRDSSLGTRYRDIAVQLFSGDESRLSAEEVKQYDRAVSEYLATLNEARDTPLRLRYYQYFAVFFSEYYFRQLANRREQLQKRLNSYIRERSVGGGEGPLSVKRSERLNKIAYWMATGSGKTYISHINYLQFRRHIGLETVDNTILIAPRKEVARQHVAELRENGFSAARMNESRGADVDILVTDFAKLDRGETGPKTIDVTEQGRSNFVLVDEGHKGLGSMGGSSLGTGWKELRDDLIGADGYSVEYSATYGSAIKTSEGYQEYSRSIIFDYPYGRFHSDGYGKDYRILNLDASQDERDTESWAAKREKWVFLNMLSYYQKLRIFEENRVEAERHNIRKPLSVFVGGRVNATRSGAEETDVQQVVSFLGRLLRDREWAVEVLREALPGTGEQLPEEMRVFDRSFDYLSGESAGDVYEDMLERIFDADTGTTLELCRLDNDEGEVGLRVTGSRQYFGVITIGDPKQFCETVEEYGYDGISVKEVKTETRSLFSRIDEEGSSLTLLIGSKKFSEGWDSTRPTNMGLMNLGRSKGPATVQMFGRGVRVEGKDGDGKRGAVSPLKQLEKLHVFGLRASYIEDFRDSLQEERVDTETFQVTVDVESDGTPETDVGFKLPVPDTEIRSELPVSELSHWVNKDFEQIPASVRHDSVSVEPTVSLSTSVESVSKSEAGPEKTTHTGGQESVSIRRELSYEGGEIGVEVLDWDAIYSEVLQHKREEGYHNIVIKKEDLQAIIDEDQYSLTAQERMFHLDSLTDTSRIEEVCSLICKRFVDEVYDEIATAVESESIVMKDADTLLPTTEDDEYELGIPEKYTLEVTESEESEPIRNSETLEEIAQTEVGSDVLQLLTHHYYQPIAVSEDVNEYLRTVEPQGINKGELRFIRTVDKVLSGDYEDLDVEGEIEAAFALRNPSGTGIGFAKGGGFYPDFIVCVLMKDGTQHIIFADPKGVRFIGPNKKKKAKFGRKIREEYETPDGVEMHSYILARADNSTTEREIKQIWSDWLSDRDYIDLESQSVGQALNEANIYIQNQYTEDAVRGILEDAIE